jgi:hypothetical protein
MVPDERRKWQLGNALEITCVCVQLESGFRQITHLGGKLPDGSMWSCSVESVIEAIESGVRYYVSTVAEAQAVTVLFDASGNKALSVGIGGGWQALLRLPRCAD